MPKTLTKKEKRDELVSDSDLLEDVMERIAEIEAVLEPLKAQEKELRASLAESLLRRGLSFVKTTSGLGFGLVTRSTFGIKEGQEDKAREWAIKNGFVQPDKGRISAFFKKVLPSETPDWIEERVTRSLQVRGSEEE